MAFVAVAANAQTWTAPTLKLTTDAVPDSAYLYHVGQDMFFTKGTTWGTHAALTKDATSALLYFYQPQEDGSYKLYCPKAANTGYLGRSTDIDLYTDYNNQAWGLTYTFEKVGDYFHIMTAAADPNYGANIYTEDVTNYGLYKMGWNSANVDVDQNGNSLETNIGVFMLDPALEGIQLDWGFVLVEDYASYAPKVTLYNLLLEAVDFGVDYAAESAVYNNEAATVDELNAAVETLKEKVAQAKVYAVLEGATEDDPKDGTSLLVNPTFDGNVDGWTITFEKGVNATNVGYQSASYTNGDVTIGQFIEAWDPNAIGVGELSQTLKSLPAGKYVLSLDAIATKQGNAAITAGVQLFAKGGDIEKVTEVATGDGLPEHFDVTFISTGGDITMGLRTIENATANWIAADNFQLWYYGAVDMDPQQAALQMLIDECNEKYPDPEELYAPQTLIDAYITALEAAQNATENFADYNAALKQAVDDLAHGVKKYEEADFAIQGIAAAVTTATENGWEDLANSLGDLQSELNEAWNEKELSLEDIDNIAKRKNLLIGEYISTHVQEGEDVTILLNNAGFDKDFSGWDIAEGQAIPAWGGFEWEGVVLVNDVEGGVQPSELGSGNAEVYRAKFDISQTILHMPAGLYTLSCQAFSRDDNGDGVQAELYAVVNGEEQTVKVKGLTEEGAPEALFTTTSGGKDWQSDVQSGDIWIPNGMCGANVYFSQGYYKNQFNIFVNEASDITVGVRDASGADWVLFDDFKLVYQGNSANAYAATIQDLIAKLLDKQAEGTMTVDVITASEDVIARAEEAIEADDAEACKASIMELEAMIVKADENLKLVASLDKEWINFTENMLGIGVESTYEGFGALLDEVGNKLYAEGGFATEQEVKDYLYNMDVEWTKYVQNDVLTTASEEAPADITPAIFNPSGVNMMGDATTEKWDDTAGAGLGNGCTELFNKPDSVSFTQTIKGLAPGWYRLGVQGFYRGIGYTTEMDANEVDTLKYYADIVAGEKATRLRSLKSDAAAYNELVAGAVEGKWQVPASMEAANTAFENGLYQNTLQFEVKEGQKEVTIGLVKTGAIADDWVMFDNWTLSYLGTAAPAKDPTTAIEGVAGSQSVGTKIYSISGAQQSRLQKGVNILKTTMSDGTVRYNKVLVK